MTSQPEKPLAGSGKKRGPYRMASAGQLPKRRAKKSIQNLAQKSAKRGQKLEYMTQTLKRRDARVTELEKLLKAANHMAHTKSEEEDLLLKQIEESNSQIEKLKIELQRSQQDCKDLKIKVESNSTAALPLSLDLAVPADLPAPIKKRVAGHSRN